MELQYWITTFKTMTTNSSLLTGKHKQAYKCFYLGFTFTAMAAATGSESQRLSMVFLAITACSMGFGLLCITSASLCLMFGREKALLGGGTVTEDALQAMDTAIAHLKKKSHQCFFYFIT